MDVTAPGRRWPRLILTLYLILGFCYSLLMPAWEAPDEPAHYHLAWYLARRGRYASPEVNYEAHQPRLYYSLAALVIRGLDALDPRLAEYVLPKEHKANLRVPERRFEWGPGNYRFLAGVHFLRWINLLIGACALWVNWKAFERIAPQAPVLRGSALALAALTPQYIHITSSVNNDTLGALAGAVLLYLAVRMAEAGIGARLWGAVALAAALPLVTKLSVLPAGMALIAAAIWQRVTVLRGRKSVAYALLGVTLALAGLWLLFPDAVQFARSELTWRLFTLRPNALTPKYLTFILDQILETYWGKVGWLAVGLPGWTVALLTGLGGIGAAMHAVRLLRNKPWAQAGNPWGITWLIALLTIGAVLRNGLTTSASQGRLLFPAIGALSLLMVGGWNDLLTLPERIRSHLHWIVLILMLVCNLIVLQFAILPTYYQPFLD